MAPETQTQTRTQTESESTGRSIVDVDPSEIAETIRNAGQRELWEAFAGETQQMVADQDTTWAAVGFRIAECRFEADDVDLSEAVFPSTVWGVEDQEYAREKLGDHCDMVIIFRSSAAFATVDIVRQWVAEAVEEQL